MAPQTRDTLRWTVWSALSWGGIFTGTAALRASTQGFSMGDIAGPLLALGLIGATVGGLTGPLLRTIVRRLRGH